MAFIIRIVIYIYYVIYVIIWKINMVKMFSTPDPGYS